MKVTLAILNKNDVEGARAVIPQVDRSLFHQIFVVDGGSTDGSIEFFKSQGLETHVLTVGGRGGAFRFAREHASGDYLVFLSSDGEENPADLPRFIEAFKQGADLVIASRLGKGAHHKAQAKVTWIHRMIALKGYTYLVNRFFGSQLSDVWNGYRGFKLSALREIPSDAQTFLIEAQTSIRFTKAGKRVMEFPTTEGQRIGGKSTIPIFKMGWAHLVLLFREKYGNPV